MAIDIPEMDDPEFTDDDTNESPPPDIVAYNELRSCADLHRMHEAKILEIQPDFQRDFVWQAADQTRFIDSLVKQLPIPSMCFALNYVDDHWIVIDGLQRMSTINRFLKGEDWKLSKLDDIDPDLSGKNAAAIKNSTGRLKTLYSRVENRSIPINVLRCDFRKKKHMEYLFTIFHRLNSGGVKLNNQEIRNCIYGGPFNQLLRELDKVPNWRRINKMAEGENYRFVKQEIILRFFAFFEREEKYQGQVAKFLNDYMFQNKNIKDAEIEEKRKLFQRVVDVVSEKGLPSDDFQRFPTSLLEAILVGVADNIDALEGATSKDVSRRISAIRKHKAFLGEKVAEGLSKKERVETRLAVAKQIFG